MGISDSSAAAVSAGTDVTTARPEDVSIEAVEFLGHDGTPSSFAEHGRPLTIRIRYDAVRPVSNPVFGVALHSSSQIHLTGTNTKIDVHDTGTISGKGHVDFAIDPLPLTPGEYELTVAISDEFVQHNFDRREREYHLVVRQGGRPTPEGFMDLQGRWTSSNTTAS